MEGIPRKLENYYIAQDLFNKKYKDKYLVRIFTDINFLHIYVDNLKENTFTHLQVLIYLIAELDVETILKGYEELMIRSDKHETK